MIIDRVIIALNNNPTYTIFWNTVSSVWKNNFGIKPTLIFNGTDLEIKNNNFNLEGCDLIRVDPIFTFENKLNWSITWSFIWGASNFKDDNCLIYGADQIPTGNLFFEEIKKYSDDKFIVGLSDAYKGYSEKTLGYFNNQTKVLYPTCYLAGKGSMFKNIYDIEDDWNKEIRRVESFKNRYYLKSHAYLWGLDECYSSEKISTYEHQDKIIYLNLAKSYFLKNRIDFGGKINLNFDMELFKKGFYSEITCKNYDAHNALLKQLISNIPIFK